VVKAMERILILSATEKSSETLQSFVTSFFPSHHIEVCYYGAEGRRLLQQKTFDFILINTPLIDEFGTDIAIFAIKQTTAGILLLLKNDIMGTLCEKLQKEGVFVLSKPIQRQQFHQTLILLQGNQRRFFKLVQENKKLQHKIEDIRLTAKAKYLLMVYENKTEEEAHKFIERQAMNTRKQKKEIAKEIILRYDERI
jgi:response regulator NasT